METGFMNRIIGLVLALVVGGLLVGGLLIPSIEGMTATEKTYTNEGYFHLDKFDEELTFYWDAAEPDTFIINGEEVTFHNNSGLSVSVVLGENFAIRVPNGNTAMNFYGGGTFVNTSAAYPTFTLTYANGEITATNGNTSKTVASVTECYAISDNGPYVMKKLDSTAYLHAGSEIIADSEIYASGQSYSGNYNIFWHMAGTIEELDYPDVFNENITVTNGEIHGKYSTVCEDIYELENITFTATVSYQSGVTYNITASYFVVPATVTAELIHHMDATQIAMFGVISILGIVALVVVAANGIRNKY